MIRKISKYLLAVTATLLLASCGLKGELYLPEPEVDTNTEKATPAAKNTTENKDDSKPPADTDAAQDPDSQ